MDSVSAVSYFESKVLAFIAAHRPVMSRNLQPSILRLSVAETKVICWADADVCRAQRSECSFPSHHTFGLFDRSAYCELCPLSPAQTDVPETYICLCHLTEVNVTGSRAARRAIKGHKTRRDRCIIFFGACVRACTGVCFFMRDA